MINGVGSTTFFVGGGTSFDTIGGRDGTDFLVTILKGTPRKEGGGWRPEGREVRLVSRGGGESVFFREVVSFLFGEGGFPEAQFYFCHFLVLQKILISYSKIIKRYDNLKNKVIFRSFLMLKR